MLHSSAYALLLTRRQEQVLQLALGLLWLALQGYWFWEHGVRMMGDSEGYINYAGNIAESLYFADNYQRKYLGYPLFMAVILKTGFDLNGVIIAQILVSGIATTTLYRATRMLAQNNLAPVIATIIFICWYDLQMFNGFILTESLYISLLILSFYFLSKTNHFKRTIFILPLLLYIATIRPNGFIVLVAYLGYAFFYVFGALENRTYKFMLLSFVIVVPAAVILLVDQYLLVNFTIVETYEKGQLIFMYDDLTIEPDQPVVMPPSDASPLMKLILFIKYNTDYFFKMAGMRFLLFWGNVKPFFSIAHNLMIVVVLYPLYFFTARVLLSKKLAAPIRVFVFLLLAQQAFITTMTSEDWNGRFLMSVIAFVFSLGAIGISWQLQKYLIKRTTK